MKIEQVPIQKTSFIPFTREAYAQKYYLAKKHGITAEMYVNGTWMVCPQIHSEKPGSGKFGDFLNELQASCADLGLTLVFASITNQGLYRHMKKHKIPVLVNGVLYNVIIEKNQDEAKKKR